MSKTRLEAFSDGVMAIPLTFVNRWIAVAIFTAVALMWLVPDRRIESRVSQASEPLAPRLD